MSNKQDKLSVSYPSYDKIRGQLMIRVILLVIVFALIFVVFFKNSNQEKFDTSYTKGKTMEELDQDLKR